MASPLLDGDGGRREMVMRREADFNTRFGSDSWTTRGEPTLGGEVARGATTRAAACYTGTPVRPLGPFVSRK